MYGLPLARSGLNLILGIKKAPFGVSNGSGGFGVENFGVYRKVVGGQGLTGLAGTVGQVFAAHFAPSEGQPGDGYRVSPALGGFHPATSPMRKCHPSQPQQATPAAHLGPRLGPTIMRIWEVRVHPPVFSR